MKSIAPGTDAIAATPPALYLDLIEIIISILASEDKRHSKELSSCALVCRDWCNVVRKTTFADVEVLTENRTRRLHELLLSTAHSTFAKHVRTAKIQVGFFADRNHDGWDDARALMTLLGNFFPPYYHLQLQIGYDVVYSHHFRDILSSGTAQNLVCLTFQQSTIFADPEELAPLLCSESLPSLRALTISLIYWDSDDGKTTVEGVDSTPRNDIEVSHKFCRLLDTLSLLATPTKYEVLEGYQHAYWPHHLFSELHVETLKFHLAENYTHPFWSESLSMLTVLSPNLIELDILYRWFNYEGITRILPKVELTRLKKLKLKLLQGIQVLTNFGGASETISTQGTEQVVADLLGSIVAPQLRCINIHICASHSNDNVTNGASSEHSTHRWRPKSNAIRWHILDGALESLRLKGLLNVYFSSISERGWELSGISESEASDILKERLPRSVSKGLLINYQGYIEDS